MNDHVLGGPELTIRQKLWQIHWFFVLMLVVVAAVGFAMLYSAAGGNVDPWAKRHALRFGAGIVLMIGVAVIDPRIWLRYAYAFYFAVLLLRLAVDVGGAIAGETAMEFILPRVVKKPGDGGYDFSHKTARLVIHCGGGAVEIVSCGTDGARSSTRVTASEMEGLRSAVDDDRILWEPVREAVGV